MSSLVVIVPGSIEGRTGGYEFDRRVVSGLRERGWSVAVHELDGSFPFPAPAARDHAARVLAAVGDGSTVLVDGLALGALPDEIEREAARLRIVALVHLPLAEEIGLDRETAARLQASEQRALAAAALVLATGRATVDALVGYGVDADRIVVVEPGTDRAALARGSRRSPMQLLCVATVNPGKGHEILSRALAAVPNRHWRLVCAGSLDRHPPSVAGLRARLCQDGLADRVELVGECDAAGLEALYDKADLFVLATLHETYGMAVAEALAHGLPVISTRTGAIADLVGADAGLLVPPGDGPALAGALSRVLGDPATYERLAAGARRARTRLPTWDGTFSKMTAALERVTRG
ncbi:MAG: glycosyltransferase family 4 protein [Acidobacteriota bacterium]